MKKLFALILVVMLLGAFSVTALADFDRTLTVSGSAQVALSADTATVQLGVSTRNTAVDVAQKNNNNVMAQVLDAIRAQNIAEEDIITSNFNVYTTTDTAITGKTTVYYNVSNMVTVTLHDITKVGALIDAAMAAGANDIDSLTFSSTHQNEAYNKALARAVEDAYNKATILATAANVSVGDVITMEATSSYYTPRTYGIANSYAYDAEASAGASIVSGDITVSASVNIVYGIK